MALKLETDPSEILNELIYTCRKVLQAVVPCMWLRRWCLFEPPESIRVHARMAA